MSATGKGTGKRRARVRSYAVLRDLCFLSNPIAAPTVHCSTVLDVHQSF